MDEVTRYRQPDNRPSHGDRERYTVHDTVCNHGMSGTADIKGASVRHVTGTNFIAATG